MRRKMSLRRYIPIGIISLVVCIILLPAFIVLGLENTGLNNFEEDIQKIDMTKDISVRVYDHTSGKITNINLEEYLIGVLAAEMPASFELDALKAQAVAARTYAVNKMMQNKGSGNQFHPGADICTDFNHAQAWIDKAEMKKRWGAIRFVLNFNKLSEAIIATQGQILVYNNKLIDPVFHADCGGTKTEDSENVWQKATPYLKSVSCLPRKDKDKSISTVMVGLKEVDKILGTQLEAVPAARLTNDKLLKTLKRTSAGRAEKVKLGDKTLTGREIREGLKLKSTNFKIEMIKNKLKFTVIGNGHGVGLCQVGSNELAKKNKNYKEILLHYYTDVEIVSLSKK